MKMDFLDIVSAPVDDKNWVILVNEDIRVMRKRIDMHNIPGTVSCIAVSTFKLEATPLEAYSFLTKHLQKIQVDVSVSEKLCCNCRGIVKKTTSTSVVYHYLHKLPF